MAAGVIRGIRSRWSGAVLVCGKCTKKLGGGFGDDGRIPLAKALRRHLGLNKGRKAALGIVESRCLGICPKRAVTVVDGRRPGEWMVVPAGTSLAEVADELGVGVSRPPACY